MKSFTTQGKFISDPSKDIVKDSLLKDLIPYRKNLFEKHSVQGMKVSGPISKIGSTTIEFSNGKAVPQWVKALYKGGGYNVEALLQSDDDFYIHVKKTISKDTSCNARVDQNLGDKVPRTYCVGIAYASGPWQFNINAHPLKTITNEKAEDVKASLLYRAAFMKGLGLGMDMILNVEPCETKFQLAAGYALQNSPSSVAVSMSHNKMLNLDMCHHFVAQRMQVGAQTTFNTNGQPGAFGAMLAALWKYDDYNTVHVKVNHQLQTAMSWKKQLSPDFTLTAATLIDVFDPQPALDNLGFKVQFKP